jgi:ABC-type multidrug transport system ATPase subunit
MELVLENLTKTYSNGVRALQGISLRVEHGMFGLLGPNGAGKSTLMRTLATLQDPDSGAFRIAGIDGLRDKPAVRRLLGYLPQEFGVYPKVAAQDLLDHFAVLKGVVHRGERRSLVERLLRQVNLWDARHRRLGTYSGGMRQRFGVAVALIGDPRLIIVDEPTAGLDPAERVRFLNLLAELGEEAIVLLSTHIVDDVRELCPRMAIIDHGRIVLEGEPAALITELRGRVWRRVVDKQAVAAMTQGHEVLSTRLWAGRSAVRVLADTSPGEGWDPVEGDLEDVYFRALAAAGSAA